MEKHAVRTVGIALIAGIVLLELLLFASGAIFQSSLERINLKSLEKSADITILALGDSTTAIGGKDSWPSQLEIVLEELNPGTTYSVINRGKVLADSAEVRENLEEHLDTYNPDTVVMMLGLNDATQDVPLQSVKSFLHHSRTYRLLEQILPNTFHPHPIAYDRTDSAYSSLQTIENFQAIKNVLEDRNIQLVVMQYPLRDLEPLKSVFNNHESIIFVDNSQVFRALVPDEVFIDSFAGDFGHCTAKGNLLIAENIADALTGNS